MICEEVTLYGPRYELVTLLSSAFSKSCRDPGKAGVVKIKNSTTTLPRLLKKGQYMYMLRFQGKLDLPGLKVWLCKRQTKAIQKYCRSVLAREINEMELRRQIVNLDLGFSLNGCCCLNPKTIVSRPYYGSCGISFP